MTRRRAADAYDPDTGSHPDAKSTSSQYTTPGAAALLSALCGSPEESRAERIRIFDPACGSGALLLAKSAGLRARYPRKRIEAYGCDIQPEAVLECRRRLRDAGDCDVVDIRLMPMGIMPDGSVRAGSLEMMSWATGEPWPWGPAPGDFGPSVGQSAYMAEHGIPEEGLAD